MKTSAVSPEKLVVECVLGAGAILRRRFGRRLEIKVKGPHASIVTDADLASEAWIIRRLRARFPEHQIIAEESGYARTGSEWTWVIDPLDGTSNFATGLPWFGVQIALLRKFKPVLAAIYLPLEEALYFAARGQGCFRNGKRVRVSGQRRAQDILCAFALDGGAEERAMRQQLRRLARLVNGVRNVRATNSLVDFCYTLEGRLGGCVNLNTKIWDIAPLAVMLPQAGGKLTDLEGRPILFLPEVEPVDRDYQVLGASRVLHPQLVGLINGAD